jgi:hypothetical protein
MHAFKKKSERLTIWKNIKEPALDYKSNGLASKMEWNWKTVNLNRPKNVAVLVPVFSF